MAIGDPQIDPLGLDPAIADALAQPAVPDWSWAPPDWNEVTTTEFGLGGVVGQPNPPPPPPPPPKDQRIGGAMGVVDELAAPQFENDIEMPPENMRPVTIGQPRAPGVGTLLGEPTVERPADFAPDPLSLVHEGQFNQTGLEQPSGPAPTDYHSIPDVGIKPEKSAEQLGLEYGQDPIKLLAAQDDYARRQKEFADENARVARVKDQMRAEENFQRQREVQFKTQADMDKLNADALALSKAKVDPGRWYRDRTTAGKIGAWVAAMVGGLVAGRTGGLNTGLNAIMKMIDDDVDAQKADLANQQQAIGARRGVIADNYARSGDAFRAAESYRIASYERVIADLQAQQQQFDPRSSRAIEIGRMIQGVAAQSQAAQAAALDRYYKLHTADAELQGKLMANESARRKLAGIGVGATKIPRAQIVADYGRDPGRDMTDKELDKWLDRTKRVADIGEVEGKAGREQVADARKYGVGDLVNADGKPFQARSELVADDLAKKLHASRQIVSIIDRIDAIRDRVGGESSAFNSDEKQQLDVLQNELVLLKKSGTQGMSSDSDLKRIEESLGATDVRSFRARAAGLKEARDRTVQDVNGVFKTNKYTGKPIEFPNAYAPRAASSADDEKVKLRQKLEDVANNGMLPKNIREAARRELDAITVEHPEFEDPRATQVGAKETAP